MDVLNQNLEVTFGIVVPILLIGLTVYLRRGHYIRRTTAYVTIAVLTLLLLTVAALISGIFM
jgi:hypothetical protein